jgi:hypothetical protein
MLRLNLAVHCHWLKFIPQRSRDTISRCIGFNGEQPLEVMGKEQFKSAAVPQL